jgi:hypothetical protein
MTLRTLSQTLAAFVLLALPGWSVAGQAQPAASPFKGEYFVTENKDDICVPCTRNLNQFRRLDLDVCHPRLSEKYPQFTRPEWKEIPFDLGVAETIIMNLARRPIGQGDPFWTEWLKASAPLRTEGKLKLWQTAIDVDGDGKPETILRLDNPLSTRYWQGTISWAIEPGACPYRQSVLYMAESSYEEPARKLSADPEDMKKNFNQGASSLTDILHFSGDNVHPGQSNGFYGVRGPIALPSRPAIGATQGIEVYALSRHGAGRACQIDWVPTGHYRPLPPARPRR